MPLEVKKLTISLPSGEPVAENIAKASLTCHKLLIYRRIDCFIRQETL